VAVAVASAGPYASQITTPAPHHCFLQAGCPPCHPTNSVKALNTTTHNKINKYISPLVSTAAHTDNAMPGCRDHLRFNILEPAVGLHLFHILLLPSQLLQLHRYQMMLLVIEAHGCKQHAIGCYLTVRLLGVKLVTIRLRVQQPNH